MAMILLLGGLLHVSVNVLVGKGVRTAILVTGGTLMLAFLCLAVAYALTSRQMDL